MDLEGLEIYYPKFSVKWNEKDIKHKYKKYCVCNQIKCFCLISLVSKSRTYKQHIYVNGALKDTICLKENPHLIPKSWLIKRKHSKPKPIPKPIPKPVIKPVIKPKALPIKKKCFYNEENKIKELNKLLKIENPTSKQIRRIYVLKNRNKFVCEKCIYRTHDKYAYNKHCLSKTHKQLYN